MMTSSRSRRSYRSKRSFERWRSRVLGTLLIILLGYLLFTSFFVEPWKLESDSMRPGYPAGSRVFVHPYLMREKDGTLKFPPARGDLVVFRPPYAKVRPWYLRIADSLIRLVTFQTLMLGSFSQAEWDNDLMIKRVIAVPGDTIRMEESTAYIRGEGENYFIGEFEASGIGYDLVSEDLPDGWTSNLPLSGNMDSIVMGEDEYFVLGDNRTGSNDSRYWGVLTSDMFYGRVFFSYWPLKSFGRIQ